MIMTAFVFVTSDEALHLASCVKCQYCVNFQRQSSTSTSPPRDFSIHGDFIGTVQWQNILACAYLCRISKSYKFGRTLLGWYLRISNPSIFNSVTAANTSSNAIPKGLRSAR